MLVCAAKRIVAIAAATSPDDGIVVPQLFRGTVLATQI